MSPRAGIGQVGQDRARTQPLGEGLGVLRDAAIDIGRLLLGGAQALDSPAVLDDVGDLDHGLGQWPDAG